MATEYTPKFNLAKPLVNGPETENTWGFDLNANFDKIDAAIDEQVNLAEVGEIIDDRVAGLIQPGANIDVAYNDAAGTLTITGLSQPINSEQIDDRVAALLVPGERIGLLYDDAANTLRISATSGEGVGYVTEAPNDGIIYARQNIGWSPISDVTSKTIVFDTKAKAEAAFIDVEAQTFVLTGYETPGDACQVLICKRVPAIPTLHDGYVRTQDRYLPNGAVDEVNGGIWEYVIPSEGIRIEWFGGKCDNVTDNIPPLERAKKCVTTNTNIATYKHYWGGPTILFGFPIVNATGVPPGTSINVNNYYFGSTIMMDKVTYHIKGIAQHGIESNAGWPVSFRFPANTQGILIKGYNKKSGSETDPGGHASVVENIRMIGVPGGTNRNAHGILVQCKATLKNVRVEHFPGHGVAHIADHSANPGDQGSFCLFENIWISFSGRSGLYVAGQDSNVGVYQHISVINNAEWGIYDDSYLGAVYIACHSRGNRMGSYFSHGTTGPALFLGCYSESGQPPSQIGSLSTFIGGLNYESGIIPVAGVEIFGKRHRGGLELHPPGFAYAHQDSITFTLRAAANHMMRWQKGISGYPHDFKYDPGSGTYLTQYANAAGWIGGLTMTSDTNTLQCGKSLSAATPGTSEMEPNVQLFPRGLYLSAGGSGGGMGNERLLANGIFPPGPTMYARGDIIFNRSPVAGGAVGWVCTTAGGHNIPAWVSGTNYNAPNFTMNNPALDHVQYGNNYYRMVGDPNVYIHNPEPTTTANFSITANKQVIKGNEGVVLTVTLGKWPLAVGRTASITLGPSPTQTSVDGVDYTPSLEAALGNAALPVGVTRSGATLTFDSTYAGLAVNISISRATTPLMTQELKTIIPHLHTPTITGGGETPTVSIWRNDPVIVGTNYAFNWHIGADRPTMNEDALPGNQAETIFSVTLMHQPMPLGTAISVDIGLAPDTVAADGIDYTPSLAGAIAAAVLPEGVTRAGNRITFTSASSLLVPVVGPFKFKLTRKDDAEIEGLEELIVQLSNIGITGATAGFDSVAIAVPRAIVHMTEGVQSTVPPTHVTVGDVHYPEPDPDNPGFFRQGYTWRLLATATAVWTPFGTSVLEGTSNYSPPALATDARDVVQTIGVVGVVLGDVVDPSFSRDLLGASLNAWVSSAGVVRCQLLNTSGGALPALGAGTLKVRVRK